MLETNCSFLENELLDVARLFKKSPTKISHAFQMEGGVFYNTFIIDGKTVCFQDRQEAKSELLLKRMERRFAKLHLYEILSQNYNQTMPWGALTGIRPTKLAYNEVEEGRSFERLFQAMYVDEDNVNLVRQILDAQKGIYEKKDGNTALFVSLPFCPTKCAYCSFITAPIEKTKQFIPPYLDCLEKELENTAECIGRLRSVYIGGGTPFALSTQELRRVLKSLAPILQAYNPQAEYTVEAGRPDVFSEEKLALLKEFGVNRICINPQTFSNETLQKIGRKHTVEEFYKAYELSKKYAFTVNIDLIAGLTDESEQTFLSGVQKAVDLQADNITVHCLSLKSGAKLKEEMDYIENDSVSTMVRLSRQILSNAGYSPYYMYRQKYQAGNNENVGWTKKGKACVYNVDVMEETTDNLAVGSNAISKRVFNEEGRIERLASPKDLKTYIEKINEIIAKKQIFFHKN